MTNFTFTAKWSDGATVNITGIERGTIELNLDGPDTATLIGSATKLVGISNTAELTIKYNTTTLLVGNVISNELLVHEGTDKDRAIKVIGHKAWLNRVTYCQPWYHMTAEGPEQIYSSRLILNAQKSGGSILPLSPGHQLKDIVDYVNSVGAPLQCMSPMPLLGAILPYEEQRDLTAAQAIDRILRYTPRTIYYADYTTTPPTIQFQHNPGTPFSPPRTLSHTETQTGISDIPPPGVIVEVERLHEIDGTQYRTLEIQEAGDTTKPNVARISFQPAGSTFNPNAKSLDVLTEPVGDYTKEAWWQARHPSLKNIDVADIKIVAAQATRGSTPEDYPNISHTPLPDLEAIGRKVRLETFAAVVDIKRRDSDNVVISEEHAIELELQLVTTNATTKTYRWTQGAASQTQEELPHDLAFNLYSNWINSDHQGTVITTCADGIPTLGQSYRSTHIRHITIDITTDVVTTQYGPSPHLSASDILAYLSTFRSTPPVRRLDSRFDGTPPAQTEDNPAIIAPAHQATITPGIPRRTVLRAAEGSANIDLNPTDDLTSGDTAKLRTLTIVDANGALKEVKALTTDPTTPTTPDLQIITDAPVALRQHTINGIPRIQVKRGTILAKNIGDWQDVAIGEYYTT